MPLPTPNDHESQDDFVSRCMGSDVIQNDYDSQEQRVAVCVSQYRRSTKGVKVLNEEAGLLGGWGIPFGGPVTDENHAAGKDLDGEYFDESTNFCLDWFPNDNRPVLYDHGTDPDVKLQVVGRQVGKNTDPKMGVWVETQLNMANQYAKYLLDLAKKGVLAYSSGALGGYVRKASDGRITQWPWIEQTLTVRPANPYALIAADAVKHLEMAGLLQARPDEAPATLGDALKAELAPGEEESAAPPADATKTALEAVAAHLEGHGWTNKAGRVMSSRNMGQLHQSMKALTDLHGATCDMGADCPMADATASKGSKPVDPASEEQRQELEEYLASIQLSRRGR